LLKSHFLIARAFHLDLVNDNPRDGARKGSATPSITWHFKDLFGRPNNDTLDPIEIVSVCLAGPPGKTPPMALLFGWSNWHRFI
jgi:hypothetical protein